MQIKASGRSLKSIDKIDTRLDARTKSQKEESPERDLRVEALDLVPLTGIEPVRSFYRGILSPLRLPVPPQRHMVQQNFCEN